jgi:hypothetical protein
VRTIAGGFALFLAAGAQAACDAPRGSILEGSTLAETRPLIVWRPVAGATGYRVRLQSRVPNGKVLASYDTVVTTTAFVSPQPLAEQRAKVQVRLSAICGGETSAEAVSSFDIDASPNCRLGELEARREGAGAELRWKAVPGAQGYEARAAGLLDGKLISSAETRSTSARLELRGQGAVVSVQPKCAAGSGEAVYRVLAAD